MSGSTIANAYVQIIPSMKGVKQKLSESMGAPAESASKKVGNIIAGNIGAFGLVKVGQKFGELISGINETNNAWNSFAKNMAMSGKSAGGIKAIQKDLQDFAAKTIYTSKDMAATYAQLYAVNKNTTTSLVKGFGAVAAAAQNPTQAMITMSTQATQMAAKPTVAWQDFKLMLEQTPAGISQIAKTMGMTTSELVAGVQSGKIATNDFFDAIEKLGSDSNGELMKMATTYKTIGQASEGLEATLQTKLAPAFAVFNQIGIQAIGGVINKVVSFFNLAAPIFEGVGKRIQEVADKILNFNTNSGVLGRAIGILGGKLATLGLEALKWVIVGICAVIETLCDGLNNLATFIEKNKLLFELLGVVIGTLAALYVSLNAATILNAIASGAQTIALTAMYAAEAIATGATTLLTGAMTLLQAPFAPIILAIAALVAIGIILYRNWDTIKAKASEIAAVISQKFQIMKSNIASVFNTIKNTAVNIWNNIKQAIVSPIEEAKNRIQAILKTVRNFFPIKAGKLLSGIKLPHFSISGSFSIAKKTVPRLRINWYKTGGIFENPSVIGVGEAGREAVVPLEPFWRRLDNMADNIVNGTATAMMMNNNSQPSNIHLTLELGGSKVAEKIYKLNKQGEAVLIG